MDNVDNHIQAVTSAHIWGACLNDNIYLRGNALGPTERRCGQTLYKKGDKDVPFYPFPHLAVVKEDLPYMGVSV